jgi:PAS domain S-box-containing protein
MKKFRFGFSLISRIALLIGIIEIIAFSVLTYLYINNFSSHIQQNLKNKIHTINTMIANEEIPASSLSQKTFMTNLIGEEYLEGMVIGNNKFIIVSTNPQYLGKKASELPSFNTQWTNTTIQESFFLDKNKLTSIAYLPNSYSNTPLYHTVIIISTQKLTNAIDEIITTAILVSILFILLSSSIIIFTAQRFITKRIDSSLEVLKDVEKGDLEKRITIQEHDELGELQSGINSMITEVALLVSQYRKTNDEIQKSKQLIRDIIDTVPVRIFWKDKNNVFLGANKLLLEDAGLDNESQIIGKTDWDMAWSDNAQSYIDDDQKVMQSNTPKLLFEEKLPLGDGTNMYLLTSKVPLIDKKTKEVYGILGVFSDITEQKLAQEEMIKKDKLLLEQSKLASMGEMIGNIAHQWRQPLSIISTASTGVLMYKDMGVLTDDMIEKEMNNINDNAQYLSKTIDDFRDFIKGERTQVQFNLSEDIMSFYNLIQGSIKSHDINLIKDIDENVMVFGYPNELIQCFINIYNNAKDVLDAINDKRYIFLNAYKQNNNVYISFKDNAGGIPEEILPHIFEPYFTTKHKSKGTGLGLSMTYKLIVEGMNGSIEAKNVSYEYEGENYKGAEFIITLPQEKN